MRGFAWRNGVGNRNLLLIESDLIEAYWRCGRRAEAAARLAEFDAWATETGLPTPCAVAERCHGILGDDDVSAHFAAAVALHGRGANPFERARTDLCHAEALRRRRQPAEARPLLYEALSTFSQLGAEPFARRAVAELEAAGERPRRSAAATGVQRLSAQEMQVARAVADGMSNPQVAAALFISRKTVEAHLSSTYRKPGVHSRTQLVRHVLEAAKLPDADYG